MFAKRLLLLILSLVFLQARVTLASPQVQCDKNLRPFAGSIGYSWRGDRCEGLYVSQISAYNLEVLSLLEGELRFDLKPDISLEITSPNVAGVSPGPINIRAVALPVGTYYRMDAALLPGDKMIWPVKDVLLPAGLSDDRIGLFGWIEGDAEKIFVPLQVKQQGKSPPAQEENSLQLMFRAMTEVESIVWRSSKETDQFSGSLKWQDLLKTPVPSGQPVTLTLPAGPATILRIEVAAKGRNSDQWSILKIRVFRP